MTPACPLCQSGREKTFTATVLKRHTVEYFYCNSCGLLQTQEPFWLAEAYTDAIAVADTGLLARNQGLARKLSALLYFCFDKHGQYVDTAGGYGVLTRLMRDMGFDFYWHDDYCINLFARGFEAEKATEKICAVTAFEVLEHVQDPLGFVRRCLTQHSTSTIILSTELFTGSPPASSDWWYYTLDTGQHISFYQRRTLDLMAKKLSLHLYSHGNIHLLTDHSINTSAFKLLTSTFSWFVYAWARGRMESLTFSDHLRTCGTKRSRDSR
jgi:hypothetical protein